MKWPHLPSDSKSSLLWTFVASIPLQIGSAIIVLYILSSDNRNKAYSLLFLIPVIGPIIAYVFTEHSDKHLSTMAGWVFLGQIISLFVLEALYLIF